MEAMATAETCRSGSCRGIMEDSMPCENGAVAVRRRRMEIRRFKMMATNTSALVEQPVSKRLRPGVTSTTTATAGLSSSWGEDGGDGGSPENVCVTDRDNAVSSGSGSTSTTGSLVVERRQENSTHARRPLSVCDDDDDDDTDDEPVVREKPGEATASSLSTACLEGPSRDERVDGGGEGDDGSNTGSGTLLNSSGCRMSSGGSGSTRSSSGGDSGEEELDAISSLISAGDPQTSVESGGEQPQEPAFNNSANLPVDSINNSFGRADDMAGSGSTGTDGEITFAGDNQDTSLVLANQQLSSWQGLGGQAAAAAADSSLGDHSSVVENAGASSSRGAVDNNCNGNNGCPPHGIVSLCGRRREMEDAVVAKPTFMELACDVVGGCNSNSSGSSQAANSSSQTPLHFFGVYDGHGGSQVANYCADRLHHTLAEETLSSFANEGGADNGARNWENRWKKAMTSCFLRMDAEVGGVSGRDCDCGQAEGCAKCSIDPIAPETVGTTAIVAVVGSCQIIVGNCGDSRAVLSRGGVAVPLSVDHKPEREDEMARVEAAGGRVIYWNGYRVFGVLAMSRAIGDRYLKPYVIAEPEVQCIKRSEDDECLILASDGLWDVMSNEVVCDIARRALNCRRNGNASAESSEEECAAAQAAALLTKLALAKGSGDNISVVVVDLKDRGNR